MGEMNVDSLVQRSGSSFGILCGPLTLCDLASGDNRAILTSRNQNVCNQDQQLFQDLQRKRDNVTYVQQGGQHTHNDNESE
jgi:hypothetical protein